MSIKKKKKTKSSVKREVKSLNWIDSISLSLTHIDVLFVNKVNKKLSIKSYTIKRGVHNLVYIDGLLVNSPVLLIVYILDFINGLDYANIFIFIYSCW